MKDAELMARAVLMTWPGNRAAAYAYFAQAINREPDNPGLWFMLSLLTLDEYESMKCLRRVLELNPKDVQAARRLRSFEESLPAPPSGLNPAQLRIIYISIGAAMLFFLVAVLLLGA